MKTTARSNLLNGLVGRFQKTLSQHNALLKYPLIGSHPQGSAETARESSLAHCGLGCQLLDGKLSVEVGRDPRQGCAKGVVLIQVGKWRLDILCLSTLAMERHNHPPCDSCGNFSSVILAHNIEGQIDSRCRSCSRQHLAIIDIEHAGIDLDFRIARSQFRSPGPVGRDLPPVQQPCGSQEEGSCAK